MFRDDQTLQPSSVIKSQAMASEPSLQPATRIAAANGLLRLKVIGPMEASTANGDNVLPLGRKTRGLLAILALSRRPVARTRLAELLWSQRSEDQGRALLRQEIHRLAEALQPVHDAILKPTRDRLAIDTALIWVDVDQALQATSANPAGLMLLDGIVLEGFDGIDPALDSWLAGERERIQDTARAIAQSILRDTTTPEQAIGAAKQLLKLDRASEIGWRSLMLAYHALGEQRVALQTFAQCRAALAELLDALPSVDMQRLAAEISSGATEAAQRSPVPDNSAAERPRSADVGVRLGVLPLRAEHLTEAERRLPFEMARELTVALSRFSGISMTSADQLAHFGERDETALRQVFGLDLLLDGSVQPAGPEHQFDLRLLDLRAGNQVWTRRFKRVLGGPLPQQALAAEIAAQIDPEIWRIESQRAASRSIEAASAYDLVLRAMPLTLRMHHEEFCRAGALLSQAIEIAPRYGLARAWRAYWLAFAVGQHWIGDLDAASDEARHQSEQALSLDPTNARSLALVGLARAYVCQEPDEAHPLYEQALTLNPNFAMGWGLAGLTSTYLGAFAEANQQFARYQQLAPNDAHAFLFNAGMALLALLEGDYAKAVTLGRRASELSPRFVAGLKVYLSALGHAGQMTEAETLLARLRIIVPSFTVEDAVLRIPLSRPQDRDCYATGLLRAGAT